MRVAGYPSVRLRSHLHVTVLSSCSQSCRNSTKLHRWRMRLRQRCPDPYSLEYLTDVWCAKDGCPFCRRTSAGAPPNLAKVRGCCNCTDIRAEFCPITPYFCFSLATKTHVRALAESRKYWSSSVMCRPCARAKRGSASKRPLARRGSSFA